MTVVGQVSERFEVDPGKFKALREAVNQLSEKARRRGLGEITLDQLATTSRAVKVQLATPTPALGDYELVAKISHMKGGRIFIHPLARGRLDFDAIRRDHSTTICEHCQVNRPRKLIYLLRSESGDVQVGSSCLKDYVGESDPRMALVQADLFAQARELAIAAAPPPTGHEPRRGWPSVVEYLAHVAAVIKHEGGEFVRKSDVEADHSATADLALRNFRQAQDGGESIAVGPDDQARAREVLEEFRERAGKERKLSGYDQRLLNVLAKDVAWPENQGIIATVFERVSSMRRHQSGTSRRRASKWLGEVGETVTAVVSLRKVGTPTDSSFGPQYPHFFLTDDGDWVTWWATNIQLEPERRYELTGEIKRLDDRKGHRVTVLKGCRTRELERA